MQKSITLYDSSKYSELLELLISSADPEGKHHQISEKLRSDFKDQNDEERWAELVNLSKSIKKGIFKVRIDELGEMLVEPGDEDSLAERGGNQVWDEMADRNHKVLITGLDFYHGVNAFLVVDPHQLKSAPSSGLGEHIVGDYIITAWRIEHEGLGFLKQYYPTFNVAEPFEGIFDVARLEAAYTQMIQDGADSLVLSLYEDLTLKGAELTMFFYGLYRHNGLFVHMKALNNLLDEVYPDRKSENQQVAEACNFDRVREIYHANDQQPVSLEMFRKKIKEYLI